MPSTCVTGRRAADPNNVPCDIVGRETCNSQMMDLHMRRWFSGRILASYVGPGSISRTIPDSIFTLTPRKIRLTCKRFDAVCCQFKMSVILLRIRSLILSKQLYGQLLVQNTVLAFPKVDRGCETWVANV